MGISSMPEHLGPVTHALAGIHERITCLNEARGAMAILEHYTEGLTGHFSGPLAHLHIELGKNELEIRRQIVALGESVATTLQPPSRRPIVAKPGLLMSTAIPHE